MSRIPSSISLESDDESRLTNQTVQRLKEEAENMSSPAGSGKRGAALAGSLKETRLD